MALRSAEVPRHVITQGLRTISAARHLVLIATGPHVTVVVDEPAAAQLANTEFYRYVLKYKPAQQKY